MEDGDGAFTDGGDRPDHFQRNEAISAVADDNFLGEEDEDDYEDLYNDVNVGEGFHQSLRGNEEVGLQKDPTEDEKKIDLCLGSVSLAFLCCRVQVSYAHFPFMDCILVFLLIKGFFNGLLIKLPVLKKKKIKK